MVGCGSRNSVLPVVIVIQKVKLNYLERYRVDRKYCWYSACASSQKKSSVKVNQLRVQKNIITVREPRCLGDDDKNRATDAALFE